MFRSKRDEDGAATAELIVATPLFLLLLMLIVQFALWQHATHVAQAAAQHGARATRLDGGTVTAGRDATSAFLERNGSAVVVDPQVAVTRNAETARVEVTAHAEAVVPGFTLPIRAVSQGPIERYRP